MTYSWHTYSGPTPHLGMSIYIATDDSRRRAVVIAIKPGLALLRYQL